MTPAEQLKAARKAARLTQAAAAERIGVPRRTFEGWEIGRRTPPEYVLRLAVERLEQAPPLAVRPTERRQFAVEQDGEVRVRSVKRVR